MDEKRRASVPCTHLCRRISEHAAHEPGAYLGIRAIAIIPLERHQTKFPTVSVPATVGECAVVRTVCLHRGDSSREHLRRERVVGIGKEHVFAARRVQSRVPGGAHALVLLGYDAHARIFRDGGGENRSRPVRRAVVDEDRLEVRQRLRAHAGKTRGERSRRVPARDDERCCHSSQSSSLGAPLRQAKARADGEQ